MDNSNLTLSKSQLSEAIKLSKELLDNIELSQLSLTLIALKCSRLARLLNDFEYQKIFEYESSGYPQHPDGYDKEIWKLLVISERTIKKKDETKKIEEYAYGFSIEALEQKLESHKIRLNVAKDPDISLSSANPHQRVSEPFGNAIERNTTMENISTTSEWISQRRSFLYKYILSKYIELSYSNVVDDIFARTSIKIAERIQELVPDEVRKFNAIHENLLSNNSEDWANAVHSSRRLFQSLSDKLYPPREDIEKDINGKKTTIKLGKEQYINRLIAYIEEKSSSGNFISVVGSKLKYIGERLDAIYGATNKGTHEVVTKEEAERYVIYTYIIIGDILSL